MIIIDGYPQEPNIDLAFTLTTALAASYESAFAESPDKAESAKSVVDGTLLKVLDVLAKAGFDLSGAQELGFDQEKFERIIAWSAFDYSVQRPDGVIETIDSNLFVAPIFAGSFMHDTSIDFMAGLDEFETTVVAMKVYRHEAGLGPVVESPSDCFVEDYQMVAGNPLKRVI